MVLCFKNLLFVILECRILFKFEVLIVNSSVLIQKKASEISAELKGTSIFLVGKLLLKIPFRIF